jgi:hypothetical protein
MRTARWGRPQRQALAILQLLDLARANAALRCEVTQLRQETESLRRLLSDARETCAGCSGGESTTSERKDREPSISMVLRMKSWIVSCDSCPYRERFLTRLEAERGATEHVFYRIRHRTNVSEEER